MKLAVSNTGYRPGTAVGERQLLGSQSLEQKLAKNRPKGEAIAYRTLLDALEDRQSAS